MSTFVLVHGAWHGGWCWYKIVSRLQARGHTVFAPDLPGHGTDRTKVCDVTLPRIVEKLLGVIDSAGEPVVLVGHSYGGSVITQTAQSRPDRIRKLVYLSAYLLSNGETTMASTQLDTHNIITNSIALSPDGMTVTLDPAVVVSALYAECSAEDVALARLLLTPEPIAGATTAIATSLDKWGKIPRVYIECLKDRAISLAHQKHMQQVVPCGKSYALNTDHSPFFSKPDELTEILAGM